MLGMSTTKLLKYTNSGLVFTLCFALTLSKSTFFTIYPSFGPIAGGTEVRLIGDWPASPSPYVVSFASATIQVNVKTQMSWINVTSPPVDKAGSHVITVQGAGLDRQNDTEFVYKENPFISAILPLRHSAVGKTVVTVFGRHLDSVMYPMIHTVVTVMRPDKANPGTYLSSTAPDSPVLCNVTDEDHMQCFMPNLNLPQDFIDKLTENVINNNNNNSGVSSRGRRSSAVSHNNGVHSRVKREIIVSSLTGADGSIADVRIAFELDGVQDFKNGVDLKDKVEFLIPMCELDKVEGTVMFKPRSDKHLYIKGAHFLRVGSKEDYQVYVGKDECVVSDVAENIISCIPSIYSPPLNENSSECPGSLSIYVTFAKQLRCFYGCMSYDDSNRDFLLAVILGTVIPSIIIVIIVIIFIIVCRRRRNRTRKIKQDERVASELSYASSTDRKTIIVKNSHSTLDRRIRKNNNKSVEQADSSGFGSSESDLVDKADNFQSLFELRGIPNRAAINQQYRYSAYQTDGSLPRMKGKVDLEDDPYKMAGNEMHSSTADLNVLQASVASMTYNRSANHVENM